jgi:transketolase
MRTGIIKAIQDLMRKDESVYFLTGDLGYSVLEEIEKEFSKRFINVGIAEQNLIGIASGLALSGKKVYVYSIIPFITMRCYEQIRNDICYHNLNITILGVGAGLSYGVLGPTHFALEDMAIMKVLPNMTIFSPADETEAVLGIKELYKAQKPVYFRIGKKQEPVVYEKPYNLKISKGNIITKGKDITIFSTGPILSEVIKAVNILKSKRISACLIDIHTIKPIDKNLIVQESKFKKHVFIIEEHSAIGGLGSAVLEVTSNIKNFPNTTLIGTADRFIKDIGTQNYLRQITGLSSSKIIDKIIKTLS